MTEHGQGYEDSGRPMIVIAEVWPVAADELGLWLLSGDGPRPRRWPPRWPGAWMAAAEMS
jgi:hypothetical protein